MRYWIAAACLAASVTTTFADDKWRDAIRQAFDLTLECQETQGRHAFQSHFVDEESFVTVVKALCKKQEEFLLEGMTTMLMERGVPAEEIIDKGEALLGRNGRQSAGALSRRSENTALSPRSRAP